MFLNSLFLWLITKVLWSGATSICDGFILFWFLLIFSSIWPDLRKAGLPWLSSQQCKCCEQDERNDDNRIAVLFIEYNQTRWVFKLNIHFVLHIFLKNSRIFFVYYSLILFVNWVLCVLKCCVFCLHVYFLYILHCVVHCVWTCLSWLGGFPVAPTLPHQVSDNTQFFTLGSPCTRKARFKRSLSVRGVENPVQMECGSSSVNINHY